MAWDALTDADVAAGKFWTNTQTQKLKDCLEYLYGQISLSSVVGIPNGSFEVDSDSDGTPDNWTAGVYSGGTKAIETTIRSHGDQGMKFIHPGGAGNGGGWIRTDYITIGTLYRTALVFSYYCSAAGMKVVVEAEWFDEAESSLGTTTLYTSTTNPTSWTTKIIDGITTYSGAYSVKFKFICGYTDTDVAGTVYLDDVRISTVGAPSVMIGHAEVTGTLYAIPNGAETASASEHAMEMPRAGIFRNLYLTADAYTTATMRRNSSDMTLSAVSNNNDTTNSFSVVAGDTISIKLVNSTGTSTALWGVEFFPNVL